MPEQVEITDDKKITKPLVGGFNLNRTFMILAVASLLLGGMTGYFMAKKPSSVSQGMAVLEQKPQTAEADKATFKDFAVGVIKAKPQPKDPSVYTEGTHILIQENNPNTVALTSSVVDLSKYEGKKVKIYGETQKALKEGWLMDVGRVEEVQ